MNERDGPLWVDEVDEWVASTPTVDLVVHQLLHTPVATDKSTAYVSRNQGDGVEQGVASAGGMGTPMRRSYPMEPSCNRRAPTSVAF